ncbi:hypothetical protein NPIL_364651 [Nephila pilipes]|uniref:Uncharacterized protein n=1 Tax=Nephila pilipes TaxID=299642 RepID=A0A8X6PG88_NEPPI|nr:hypothetical protein NPIL_364651 [Nephila pilipes]
MFCDSCKNTRNYPLLGLVSVTSNIMNHWKSSLLFLIITASIDRVHMVCNEEYGIDGSEGPNKDYSVSTNNIREFRVVSLPIKVQLCRNLRLKWLPCRTKSIRQNLSSRTAGTMITKYGLSKCCSKDRHEYDWCIQATIQKMIVLRWVSAGWYCVQYHKCRILVFA